jgi:DNA-binding HxlR family transcriptional regulator
MPVTQKRTYRGQEYCPVARTLEIVGDRWTLLVLRDIFLHRRKFNEILESLEGISPNLLADRLKRLEETGMLTRRFYSDHPPRAEYWLTDKGKAFGKVIQSLKDWGEAWEPEAATA